MVIHYMLDTDICIALIKNRPESIRSHLSKFHPEEIGISGIVAAELWFGVANSQKKKKNEAALNDFFEFVSVLDWPQEASSIYGRVRSHLKKSGTPIGAMDLLIATHALFLNSVLVTNNLREFERIPNLKIENWLM